MNSSPVRETVKLAKFITGPLGAAAIFVPVIFVIVGAAIDPKAFKEGSNWGAAILISVYSMLVWNSKAVDGWSEAVGRKVGIAGNIFQALFFMIGMVGVLVIDRKYIAFDEKVKKLEDKIKGVVGN